MAPDGYKVSDIERPALDDANDNDDVIILCLIDHFDDDDANSANLTAIICLKVYLFTFEKVHNWSLYSLV